MSTGAPIEQGTPIRMPSTALMLVNSEDATEFNSAGFRTKAAAPGEIYINQQSAVMFGYMTRLALTEVNIQWDVPNVNETNNTLTLQYYNNSGVSQGFVRITLAPLISFGNFYTGYELGRAVESALNTNATLTTFFGTNTFLCTCGQLPVPGVLTAAATIISNNANFRISTSSTNGYFQIMPPGQAYTGLPRVADDLTTMMGLIPSVAPSGTPYYRQIDGTYASMQYTPYIDIVSNLLTKNQNVSDGSTANNLIRGGVLARVYFSNNECTPRVLTAQYDSAGNVVWNTDNAIGSSQFSLRREFNTPKQIQWNSTENVDVVDIEIRAANGELLYSLPIARAYIQGGINKFAIGNTANIQMTFQATEV
jgi:hypothetical protein